jgi:hypothetical protein
VGDGETTTEACPLEAGILIHVNCASDKIQLKMSAAIRLSISPAEVATASKGFPRHDGMLFDKSQGMQTRRVYPFA